MLRTPKRALIAACARCLFGLTSFACESDDVDWQAIPNDAAAPDTVRVQYMPIEHATVDGVSLFRHAHPDHNDAELSGPLSIVDGCLALQQYVVVWHASNVERIEAVVSAVRSGRRVRVSVGGSGISREEDRVRSLPLEIESRCDVDAVWFGSPDLQVTVQ